MCVVSITDHSHMCRRLPEATLMIALTSLFPMMATFACPPVPVPPTIRVAEVLPPGATTQGCRA